MGGLKGGVADTCEFHPASLIGPNVRRKVRHARQAETLIAHGPAVGIVEQQLDIHVITRIGHINDPAVRRDAIVVIAFDLEGPGPGPIEALAVAVSDHEPPLPLGSPGLIDREIGAYLIARRRSLPAVELQHLGRGECHRPIRRDPICQVDGGQKNEASLHVNSSIK